jgi:hypothetical protein
MEQLNNVLDVRIPLNLQEKRPAADVQFPDINSKLLFYEIFVLYAIILQLH